jgi:N-acetyl-anhydromuramyl-L-alanine amidase AmpD
MVDIWSPNFRAGRPRPPSLIVWHSTESDERTGGAEAVAKWWFGRRESGVSAHIVVDRDTVVRCVSVADTAWHAARVNARSIGIELVGRAGQTEQQWRDRWSIETITNACQWIKSDAVAATIPPRWLSDGELSAGSAGHTTHAQVSRVIGGTDHTDPGPHFPSELVMQLLAPAEWDTVSEWDTGPTVRRLQAIMRRVFAPSLTVDGVFGPKTRAVVMNWQKSRGLTADGIAGPITWMSLTAVDEESNDG